MIIAKYKALTLIYDYLHNHLALENQAPNMNRCCYSTTLKIKYSFQGLDQFPLPYSLGSLASNFIKLRFLTIF